MVAGLLTSTTAKQLLAKALSGDRVRQGTGNQLQLKALLRFGLAPIRLVAVVLQSS